MRYSFAFTGLVTVAFSSGALAQTTEPVETIDPVPTSEPVVPPTSVVPTSVVPTSSVAPLPLPTDPCLADCNAKHDACNSAPGANHASCASDYAQCLGYNPYAGTGFVEPTACSKSMTTVPVPQKTESPEVCCVTCTTTYKACCDAAGDVIDHCKIEYTTCLGYNPFDIIPWVEPTVCKHNEPKPPKPTGNPEECCIQCTTVYDSCCAADGAIIENCKAEYTICLGYNPWDIVPWEKPYVCKHGDGPYPPPKKGGDHKDGKIIVGPPTKQPSGTPEECCVTCTTTYKACCDAAGDVIDHCKVEYTTCLGYNPFDIIPWIEPTVCKHDSYPPKGQDGKIIVGPPTKQPSGTPEECCIECTTVYKQCCDEAGDVIDHCKVAYTTCLGYNPFDIIPWVEPTVCKHGDSTGIKKGGDSKDNGGKIISGPPTSQTGTKPNTGKKGTPEECCIECTAIYKKCCDEAGDVIDHCKVAYTSCLGYSPFEVVPWVEPTVCKHPDDDIVIVSGGENLRPALALLVLGAIALLCKSIVLSQIDTAADHLSRNEPNWRPQQSQSSYLLLLLTLLPLRLFFVAPG
ncbi:hypothetical protein NCS56_01356600 [Fusarium sp. Ph1]|nr:hypothetical protein NCS56_01356600 [Fusarium sp. Ph1]